MKILHVLDHSLPVQDGYAFRSREILRFTGGLGVETVQVTSAKHPACDAEHEDVDGLRYHRTRLPGGLLERLPAGDQVAVITSLRARLRALVDTHRPDLLHAHSPALNGAAASLVARERGIPFLYEVRSLWEDAAVDGGACREGDLRYRLSRALESWVVRRADHVVCICEGLRGEMAGRGIPAARMSVIGNAVDIGRFGREPERDPRLEAELGLVQGRTLGFIGSFFTFEGLQVLVRAMPAILAELPDCRLLLVGEGPESAALRALSAELGVSDAVVFTGRVPHADVERYYGVVDVLVYPRLPMRITELVTPLKPLEAMAMRKLVLASDVGGHREMVRDGETGTLFRAGSPEDLARAAVSVMRSAGTRDAMRDAGRRYVTEERSWARNADAYLALYRRLTGVRERVPAVAEVSSTSPGASPRGVE